MAHQKNLLPLLRQNPTADVSAGLSHRTYNQKNKRLGNPRNPRNPEFLSHSQEVLAVYRDMKVFHYNETVLGKGVTELIAQQTATLRQRNGSPLKTSRPTQKRKRSSDLDHSLTEPMRGVTHHCFACSQQNRNGLHLRFQENPDNGSVECEFRMPRRFEGPPGHLHGGIIATILDEAMGKVNRRKGIVALTAHMSIDYLEPVPLTTKLRAFGWQVKIQGRKHFHAAEICALDGTVLARSQGTFIAINPVEMFRKYTQRLRPKGK